MRVYLRLIVWDDKTLHLPYPKTKKSQWLTEYSKFNLRCNVWYNVPYDEAHRNGIVLYTRPTCTEETRLSNEVWAECEIDEKAFCKDKKSQAKSRDGWTYRDRLSMYVKRLKINSILSDVALGKILGDAKYKPHPWWVWITTISYTQSLTKHNWSR